MIYGPSLLSTILLPAWKKYQVTEAAASSVIYRWQTCLLLQIKLQWPSSHNCHFYTMPHYQERVLCHNNKGALWNEHISGLFVTQTSGQHEKSFTLSNNKSLQELGLGVSRKAEEASFWNSKTPFLTWHITMMLIFSCLGCCLTKQLNRPQLHGHFQSFLLLLCLWGRCRRPAPAADELFFFFKRWILSHNKVSIFDTTT